MENKVLLAFLAFERKTEQFKVNNQEVPERNIKVLN